MVGHFILFTQCLLVSFFFFFYCLEFTGNNILSVYISKKMNCLKKVKTPIFQYQGVCLKPVKIVILSLFKWNTLSKNMSLCLEGL
jgi:hypothetical protein